MVDCARLLATYLGNLEEQFSVEPEGEDCILTTPFLSPDNDPIQIRLSLKGESVEMSDMGESIGFLFLHGVELKPNSRQRWFFDTTLRRLGMAASESEITTKVPVGQVLDAIIRLTEAIRSAQHIVMTAKARSRLSFSEDVAEWLTGSKVDFRRSVDYTGAAGKHYTIDFEVAMAPVGKELTLMYAFQSNTPGWANALANRAIVSFLEIKESGLPAFQSACLLDDTVDDDVWTGPIVATLRRHTDVVGFWEEKEDFLESVAGRA